MEQLSGAKFVSRRRQAISVSSMVELESWIVSQFQRGEGSATSPFDPKLLLELQSGSTPISNIWLLISFREM